MTSTYKIVDTSGSGQRLTSHPTEVCLLCSRNCKYTSNHSHYSRPTNRKEYKAIDRRKSATLSPVAFLLKDLLRLEFHTLEKKYTNLKPLLKYLKLCPSCIKIVDSAAEIQKQIELLEVKINGIKENLRNIVKKGPQKGKFGENVYDLYKEIRNAISASGYNGKNQADRVKSGIYFSTTMWTSVSEDPVCGLSDFETEPQMIFMPTEEVRKSNLLQMDPLELELDPSSVSGFESESDEENPEASFSLQEFPIIPSVKEISDAGTSQDMEITITRVESIGAALMNAAKTVMQKDSVKGSKPILKRPAEQSDSSPAAKKAPLLPNVVSEYPCPICKTVMESISEVTQHWELVHPGFSVCIGPGPGNLHCGKVFIASDLKQHKKEAHPLFHCTSRGCSEAFSSQQLRSLHIRTSHLKHPLPPDVPLVPLEENLVKPLNPDEIRRLAQPICNKAVEESTAPIEIEIDDVDSLPNSSGSENEDFTPEIPNVNLDMETDGTENATETKSDIPSTDTRVATATFSTAKSKYKCGLCNKIFTERDSLTSHFESEHGQRCKLGCFICRKEFDSATECVEHIKATHQNHKTSAGVKTYGSKNTKKPPVVLGSTVSSKKRKSASKPSYITTNVISEYKCPGCPESFEKLEHFLAHERDRKRLNYCKAVTPSEIFKCPEEDCDRPYYQSENALLHHRIREHNHPKPVFECNVCFKKFREANVLRRHQETHKEPEERVKFHCNLCSNSYTTKNRLNFHVKSSHENQRPFECTICNKTFTTRTKLAVHKAIHYDERPFLCWICGKNFKTYNNLYIHGWSHDPDRKNKYNVYKPKGKNKSKQSGDSSDDDIEAPTATSAEK